MVPGFLPHPCHFYKSLQLLTVLSNIVGRFIAFGLQTENVKGLVLLCCLSNIKARLGSQLVQAGNERGGRDQDARSLPACARLPGEVTEYLSVA